MAEWRSVRLGDLVEIFDGPHATPKKTVAGPVFLGISNLERGRIDLSNAEHLSEEDFERWTRRITPRSGDLVFSYETRLGEAAIVPDGLRCCLGRRMGLLRARPGQVDSRFLLYVYLGDDFQETLRARTIHGSTVDRIPLIDMPNFPIRVPASLEEQRRIAHILGTLDDKIELNRRMNETLEAMARALFKSWFVDFDPVRAKMAGRYPGLPKDIADLFPDRLVESELGWIPEGWKWRALGELVELTRGTTYKSSIKGLPGPVLLGLASIQRNGGFRGDKLQTYGGESPAKLLLRPGDLFISLKDVTQSADLLGAVARVPPYVQSGRLTQDTVKLSFASRDVSPEILYRSLLSPGYREHCRAHATGTTNLGLSREDFLAFRVPQPCEPIQKIFDDLATSIEGRQANADAETRSLAALKDALLPKMLSGEFRLGAE